MYFTALSVFRSILTMTPCFALEQSNVKTRLLYVLSVLLFDNEKNQILVSFFLHDRPINLMACVMSEATHYIYTVYISSIVPDYYWANTKTIMISCNKIMLKKIC